MAKEARRSGEARRGGAKQRASPPPRRRQKQGHRQRPAESTPSQPDPAAPEIDSQSAVLAPAAGVPSAPAGPAIPLRAIEPPKPGPRWHLAEIGRRRPTFLYYMRRYLRKRYGRTFLGYIWLFLPVLLPLFMGSLVFGGILGVSVPGVPYFVYFAVALSSWLLFSQTAYLSTRSLEISRTDLRRIYTPRLIPLMGAVTLPTVTFLIYMVIFVCSLVYYVLTSGQFYLVLSPETLLVPVALVMLVLFGWACGLWFSPLAPRARDVRRLAGYVIGFWYFLTPVMYPISQIAEGYRFLASLNPITAPIELVKDGLLGVGHVTSLGVVSYFVSLVLISALGLRMFLSKERRDMAFY